MNVFSLAHLLLLFLLTFGVLSSKLSRCDIQIGQILLNYGFHRNLSYTIHFHNNEKTLDGCLLGLEQMLPPGAFANPDELQDLARGRKINAVTRHPVNVELPREQASPISVFVTDKLNNNRASMWLPVHARYHSARPGGGMADIEIKAPKIYIKCPINVHKNCHNYEICDENAQNLCNWNEISHTLITAPIIWPVPVGDTNNQFIVSTGTALVIGMGSLYLLKVLHDAKMKLVAKSKV